MTKNTTVVMKLPHLVTLSKGTMRNKYTFEMLTSCQCQPMNCKETYEIKLVSVCIY